MIMLILIMKSILEILRVSTCFRPLRSKNWKCFYLNEIWHIDKFVDADFIYESTFRNFDNKYLFEALLVQQIGNLFKWNLVHWLIWWCWFQIWYLFLETLTISTCFRPLLVQKIEKCFYLNEIWLIRWCWFQIWDLI